MFEIGSTMTGNIQRPDRDVLRLLRMLVEAGNISLVIGIDDQWVARIGNDETAFSITGRIPMLTTDYSVVCSARNCDVGVILLCSVNVVRKSVVYRHMVKLGGGLVVLCGPRFAAIGRDTRSTVVGIDQALSILRIDPQTVMITVGRGQ